MIPSEFSFDQSLTVMRGLGRPLVLAPKNEVTEALAEYFKSHAVEVAGFSDRSKTGPDILSPAECPRAAVALVYSPSHWKAILERFEGIDALMVLATSSGLRFRTASGFDGYSAETSEIYNNDLVNRRHWRQHLVDFVQAGTDYRLYGLTWGDPERADDPLGNYLRVKDYVARLITAESTILDLGCAGGKWTQYFGAAKAVVCFDVNDTFVPVVMSRFESFSQKIHCVVGNGIDLGGISDGSIDILFCMDTFSRLELSTISNYFREFGRILTSRGRGIVHLPCVEIEDSRGRHFTPLGRSDVESLLQGVGVVVRNQGRHPPARRSRSARARWCWRRRSTPVTNDNLYPARPGPPSSFSPPPTRPGPSESRLA